MIKRVNELWCFVDALIGEEERGIYNTKLVWLINWYLNCVYCEETNPVVRNGLAHLMGFIRVAAIFGTNAHAIAPGVKSTQPLSPVAPCLSPTCTHMIY